MKMNLKGDKGISLISLVVAVIVLLILSGMIIYKAQDTVYIQNLTNLYNDIDLLREKVSDYYEEYGELPVSIKYTNTNNLSNFDSLLTEEEKESDFYVIDLEQMEGITLNFGKDYENVKNDSSNVNTYTDLYIINEESHNIFLVEGVIVDEDGDTEEIYYTDYLEPDNAEIDLRYIDGILIPDGYYYIGENEENKMVISNVQGDTIDETNANQYTWINQVSILDAKPDSVTLDNNTQNEEDFLTSVNFYKGYFKNRNGYVQYSKPRGNSSLADGTWSSTKRVNTPQLMKGMTAIKFKNDGTSDYEELSTAEFESWYDYYNNQWANAITKDDEGNVTGYWVWIPRYAYKIESGLYTSTTGTISVEFLQGTTNRTISGSTISEKYPTVTNDAMDDYVVHPAFTDGTSNNFMNGEWDEEVPGFWVAKFPAGYAEGNNSVTATDTGITYSGTYSSVTNYYESITSGTTTMKYPVFLGQTYAYNYINIGDSYNLALNLTKDGNPYGLSNKETNSHQMKNSEWGAVAYISHSEYGLNGENLLYINNVNLNNTVSTIYAVTGYAGDGTDTAANTFSSTPSLSETSINNGTYTSYAWYTTNGQKGSSTQNITGVYDLSGCIWERTSTYISNGSSNLSNYASTFANTTANADGYKSLSTKLATVYPYNSSSDTEGNNWIIYNTLKSSTYGFGDAILEIASAGLGSTGWENDESIFLSNNNPFLARGGSYLNAAIAGKFNFCYNHGLSFGSRIGFRAVLFAE